MTRTWHVQLGMFWIATAWLAAGLFIGPLVSGVEPKGQRLGVNVLFVRAAGRRGRLARREWLSVQNKLLGRRRRFYFGHQGYEYVDLGRVWQIALLRRAVALALPDGPGAAARRCGSRASRSSC